MAQARAKKLSTYRDKHFTTIEYEYRGCKYEVTYANGWTVCCTPAWVQHRDAQAEIDEMLDHPTPVRETEHKPIEEQMDEIWEMMGW